MNHVLPDQLVIIGRSGDFTVQPDHKSETKIVKIKLKHTPSILSATSVWFKP